MLLERRYLSRNAPSRRRNFTDTKFDEQDAVVEAKGKESSTVQSCDSEQKDAESNSCSDKPACEKENKAEAKEEKEEEGRDEGEGEESQDEEESQEETNKAVEWSKDDQKNLMDLGISEMERNRRLESLIARRRARQQMKLQMEQGLTDFRASPSRMAPLNITRTDPLKNPRNYGGIDGLEIPGSAPSALRPSQNPFDLPYDACEERPNLRGGSFCQEFTSKDMAFRRHESFSYGASLQFDEESNPFFINGRRISDRFRRLPDEGNHELIIEKLFSKSNDSGVNISTVVKAPKPLLVKFEETTPQENKARTKWKKLLNATRLPKSFSSHRTGEPSRFMENINHDGFGETYHYISEKPEEEEESKTPPHHHKPFSKKFLNFPIATGTAAIFEAPLDSPSSATSRNQEEDMPFPDGCIFHKPTCSIASDLQVEFSEIGSPTALTTDGESEVFDGDIDKEEPDLTPRSDDLGPISIKLRSCEEGTAEEMNNDSPKSSPIPLRQKVVEEEKYVIDVSSLSSTSDLNGDSPTHAKINYDYSIFSDMRKDEVETQATLPSNFLIGRSLDHPPHETQPQKPEERQNLSENSETQAQVVDHHHGSSSSSTSDSHGDTPTHEKINYDYNVFSDMKKDEVETQATQPSNSSDFLISRSVDYTPHESQSEKPDERQYLSETEAQILDHYVTNSPNTDVDNSNSNEELRPPVVHQHQESIDVSMNTFSSLSPEKTLMDQVSSSAFNQHTSTDVPQLNIEDMTLEPSNSELPSNTKPPILQPLSIDPVALTHTSVSSVLKEPTCSSTMADDYNTTDKSSKLNSDDVDRKENDTEVISRNMDPAEEKSEDKSTSVVRQDDSIQSLTSPQMKTLEETNNKSEAVGNDEVTSTSPKATENVGISTTIEYGQKAGMLTQLADVDPPKPNKPTGTLEEASDMHGESKKDSNEEEITRELKDEIPPKPSLLIDSSEEKNNVHGEPMKNDAEITEKLKNYFPEYPGEINNSSEEVSKILSEPKQNDPEMSNKVEVNELSNNDTSAESEKQNDSSEEVSKVQSEPKQNGPEMSNKVEVNELLNNDTSAKSDKQNDSSEEVSKVQSETKLNDPEVSNKVEVNELLNNETLAKSDQMMIAQEK
ncbi:hypothetical protein K1719_019903 [Acacia pycnantha]|nr:hypothetical protein K1719_019903 [Acacia pycnantha]